MERLEYGGSYWFAPREQLMHGFLGFVRKKEFALSSEVAQAKWVSLKDAPGMMLPEAQGNCCVAGGFPV